MKNHFEMFAAYNRWANERMYQAASQLSNVDYRANRGAFFGSVHNTLNHILVGDRIWMARFTGEGDAPGNLDEILYDDFETLRMARRAEDARIINWIQSLKEQQFYESCVYQNMSGETFKQILAAIVPHLFNHQTHHRGQVHCLLTGLGSEVPSLDMIAFQRELEDAA